MESQPELRGGNIAIAIVMTTFFFACAAIFIIGALEVPSLVEGPPQSIEQKAFLLSGSALAGGMAIFLMGTLNSKMRGALFSIGAVLVLGGLSCVYHFGTIIWLASH